MPGDYQGERGRKMTKTACAVHPFLEGSLFCTANLASCVTQFEVAHVTSYEDICVYGSALLSANSE